MNESELIVGFVAASWATAVGNVQRPKERNKWGCSC